MGGSIKIANVNGIPVNVHVTFLVLLVWSGYNNWAAQGTAEAVLKGMGSILAVFTIVVLHELGHAWAGSRFGVVTRDITLLPIGGVARMDRIPKCPREELVIAMAGPAVNLVLAAILLAGLAVSGTLRPLSAMGMPEGPIAEQLVLINVTLLMFNLLPAFPLDGGRALRALLAMRLPYVQATRAAASAGQAFALLLAGVGLLGNPLLLLIALFVWLSAEAESRLAFATSVLENVPARRAMIADFRILSPGDTLAQAVERMLASSQRGFPVVGPDGHVLGLLSEQALLQGLAQTPSATVGDIMCRELASVAPSEALSDLLPRIQASPCRALAVVERGELLGLLTLENLVEYLRVQEAAEHG